MEVDEELKPFINNYKLNLFDYHDYDEFSQFSTENRFIFELLLNSQNEAKTGKIMGKYLNDYSLDEESAKAIFGMLDINEDIDKYKKKTEKGDRYYMCKAWDDHKERGRQEGLQEGLNSLVNILSTIFSDFDTIYNKIISDEKYQNVTKEQVEKYYYAK